MTKKASTVIPFPVDKARSPGGDPSATYLRREADKYDADSTKNTVLRTIFVSIVHRRADTIDQARGNLERANIIRCGDISLEASALIHAEYERLWRKRHAADNGEVVRIRK